MTRLMEKAVEALRSLPEEQQDAVAGFVLSEIESDRRWTATSLQHADKLRKLADEAREILGNVKTTKPGTAVQAIRAVAQVLELQAKILGEIRAETQVNVGIEVLNSPEWGRVVSVVTGALLPYPEARAAVADALAGLAHETRVTGSVHERL